MDDDRLADWLDLRMRDALKAQAMVGGAVAITSGDGRVFSAGYGHASLAADIPADAALTPFRSGSTNKVMTSLLALQMVEEGKLDLDRSIAQYLTRIEPPEPFGPVTVLDLLTHAGGYEERFQGTLTDRELAEVAPAESVKRLWCRQVRPAGDAVQYSNFAFALLGTLLEDVSGSTYRELLASRVFEPLGMASTGVELAGHLPERCASEHWFRTDGSVRQPDTLFKTPFYLPAGGLYFSAEDAASFVSAFLRPDSAVASRQIHQAMLQPRPSIPGGAARGLGWWLSEVGEDVLFRHGGSTESFDMTMLGIPSLDRGIVIMRTGDWDWRQAFGVRASMGRRHSPVAAFDTYTTALGFAEFATGDPVRPMRSAGRTGARLVSGSYLATRRAHSTSERLTDLAETEPYRVQAQHPTMIQGSEVQLSLDGSWCVPDGGQVFEPVPGRPARLVRMGSALFERRHWYDRRTAVFGALVLAPLAAATWWALAGQSTPAGVVATGLAATAAALVIVQTFWPPVHWRLRSPMTPLLALVTYGLVAATTWAGLAGDWMTALLLLPGIVALIRNRAHRPG